MSEKGSLLLPCREYSLVQSSSAKYIAGACGDIRENSGCVGSSSKTPLMSIGSGIQTQSESGGENTCITIDKCGWGSATDNHQLGRRTASREPATVPKDSTTRYRAAVYHDLNYRQHVSTSPMLQQAMLFPVPALLARVSAEQAKGYRFVVDSKQDEVRTNGTNIQAGEPFVAQYTMIDSESAIPERSGAYSVRNSGAREKAASRTVRLDEPGSYPRDPHDCSSPRNPATLLQLGQTAHVNARSSRTAGRVTAQESRCDGSTDPGTQFSPYGAVVATNRFRKRPRDYMYYELTSRPMDRSDLSAQMATRWPNAYESANVRATKSRRVEKGRAEKDRSSLSTDPLLELANAAAAAMGQTHRLSRTSATATLDGPPAQWFVSEESLIDRELAGQAHKGNFISPGAHLMQLRAAAQDVRAALEAVGTYDKNSRAAPPQPATSSSAVRPAHHGAGGVHPVDAELVGGHDSWSSLYLGSVTGHGTHSLEFRPRLPSGDRPSSKHVATLQGMAANGEFAKSSTANVDLDQSTAALSPALPPGTSTASSSSSSEGIEAETRTRSRGPASALTCTTRGRGQLQSMEPVALADIACGAATAQYGAPAVGEQARAAGWVPFPHVSTVHHSTEAQGSSRGYSLGHSTTGSAGLCLQPHAPLRIGLNGAAGQTPAAADVASGSPKMAHTEGPMSGNDTASDTYAVILGGRGRQLLSSAPADGSRSTESEHYPHHVVQHLSPGALGLPLCGEGESESDSCSSHSSGSGEGANESCPSPRWDEGEFDPNQWQVGGDCEGEGNCESQSPH